MVALILAFSLLRWELYGLQNIPFAHSGAADRITNIRDALQHPVGNLAAHSLMVHGLIPNSLLPRRDVAILSPAWSMSVEAQIYLLAPAVVFLISKGKWGIIAACSFSVLLYLIGKVGPLAANGAFIGRYAFCFAAGIAAQYVQAARALSRWAPWLAFEPLRTLGKWSYSTYLFHLFPVRAGAAALAPLRLPPAIYAVMLCSLTIISTLILSWLSFTFIEAPMIRLGERLTRGGRPPPKAAAAEVVTAP